METKEITIEVTPEVKNVEPTIETTLLEEIMAFLFGRKYYANIIKTKGVLKQEVSSYIFATRRAADRHRQDIESTRTYGFVETVSFRSKKICLDATVKRYKEGFTNQL